MLKGRKVFSGCNMVCLKQSSLMVLLLTTVALTGIGDLLDHVSAQPDDSVEMSPGTYAHTLGTPANIVKLDYPKSSIMQNTTGDISLNLTLTGDRSSIAIYIPPEFSFLQPDTRSIWTSITNDYKHVSIVKLKQTDPIGPLWWNVAIADLTIPTGSYIVKLFDIKSPDVCGRYFMKVFIDGESIGSDNFPTVVVECDLNPAYISGRVLDGRGRGLPVDVSGKVIAEGTTALGRTVKAQAYFDGTANGSYGLYGLASGTYRLTASAAGFPLTAMDTLVSVGAGQSLEGIDVDVYAGPTISGTVASKCGLGLIAWGYVYNWTIGQVPRPITIEISDPDGELKALVIGETDPFSAYYHLSFNGSAELDGHVPQDYAEYVSGLESGDYYLKAFVNGYVQRDVIVTHVHDSLIGISVAFDVWRSSWFEVTVFFRQSEDGPLVPTPGSGLLTLKAYELDGTLRGWNSTFVPEGSLTWAMTISGLLGLASSRDYGFPGGTYIIEADFSGYLQTGLLQATVGEGCSATSFGLDMVKGGVLEITLRSVNWQTPPQEVPWEYPDTPIRLEVTGSTGQVYFASVNQQAEDTVAIANITGLPTDTYLVRAYALGYIQTKDYLVAVSIGSTSGMMIDLVKGTKIQMTLIFKTAGLVTSIDTYRYNPAEVPVRVEVYDSFGTLVGANATYTPGDSSYTVEVVGFHGYPGNPCSRWTNYYDTTDGWLQKDYGLPAGTYLIMVWVPGYSQLETISISTSHGGTAGITVSLDRLSHVFGNVSGLNMYEDLIPLSWATVTAYGVTLSSTSSQDGFYEMWLENGTYMLAASSLGYETRAVEVYASNGSETPIDFDLRPSSTAIPELYQTDLILLSILIISYTLLQRKKPQRNMKLSHRLGW